MTAPAPAELQTALAAVTAAGSRFTVSDLAERVTANRIAAGKPALPADELHESCRVFLGRRFGFATEEEELADLDARVAGAEAEGPDAVLRLIEELKAQAAEAAGRADVLHVELIRRRAA